MIISGSIVARRTKILFPALHSSRLFPSLSQKLTFILHCNSLSSSGSLQDSDDLNIFNKKDWLSPTEVVKIFQTLEDPSLAFIAFNKLSKRKDYKPTEAIYTAVIIKLAQAKNFDAIDDVMKRIKLEKRCRLSDDFFYNVIKIYGNVGGRINRAIETLFDMPNYNCWPNVKTFNFVLNLVVCSKQFDIIHEIYMGAWKLGVEIDACCLNIIIKGLCGCGNLDAALYVLDEFPKQGCVPNVKTFSTLMHGFCKHKRIDDAFRLMERMEKEGVESDAIAFNILISGLRKQGRVEEAINLFDKMMLKGCNPNQGTYQEILYALLDAKRIVEAKTFMGKMILKNIKPSFESYKLMVHGLCDEKLLGDVNWVLKQMASHRFVPNMRMWSKILQCMFSGNSKYFSYEELIEH